MNPISWVRDLTCPSLRRGVRERCWAKQEAWMLKSSLQSKHSISQKPGLGFWGAWGGLSEICVQPVKSVRRSRRRNKAHHPEPFLNKGSWCQSPASGTSSADWRAVEKSSGSWVGMEMAWLRWLSLVQGPEMTELQAPPWGREKNRHACKLAHTQFIVSFSCDKEREGRTFISQWDTRDHPLPSEEMTSYCGRKQRHTRFRYRWQTKSLPRQTHKRPAAAGQKIHIAGRNPGKNFYHFACDIIWL